MKARQRPSWGRCRAVAVEREAKEERVGVWEKGGTSCVRTTSRLRVLPPTVSTEHGTQRAKGQAAKLHLLGSGLLSAVLRTGLEPPVRVGFQAACVCVCVPS